MARLFWVYWVSIGSCRLLPSKLNGRFFTYLRIKTFKNVDVAVFFFEKCVVFVFACRQPPFVVKYCVKLCLVEQYGEVFGEEVRDSVRCPYPRMDCPAKVRDSLTVCRSSSSRECSLGVLTLPANHDASPPPPGGHHYRCSTNSMMNWIPGLRIMGWCWNSHGEILAIFLYEIVFGLIFFVRMHVLARTSAILFALLAN